MGHNHHHDHLEAPPKVQLPKQYFAIAIALMAVGALAFLGGLFAVDATRAWKGYLMGLLFATMIALFGPFFIATQYLARSGWSVTLRRIPEAFWPAMLPLGVLGTLFAVGGGVTHVFEWPELLAQGDPILLKKAAYLNMPRMVVSTILGFAVWGGFGYIFSKNSQQQDETGSEALNKRNGFIAPIFLIFMSLAITTFSVDFIMALHPHWFSTMWAVNFWSSSFQAGLAFTVMVAFLLHRNGVARGFIGHDHIHDIGKLLFASTAFWAYIAFCQFMLMWYANLPEEASFWNARFDWNHPGEHPWTAYTIAMPLLKFVLPFFMLLPRAVKRGENPILLPITILILVMAAYEVFWWVGPAPSPGAHGGGAHHGGGAEHAAAYAAPVLPWLELLILLGFFGIFLYAFGWAIQRANIVPIKDPRLHEALHHHQ
jgi:hypothetical protein